jgi:chromatin structure-remodeling complex protein RSC7
MPGEEPKLDAQPESQPEHQPDPATEPQPQPDHESQPVQDGEQPVMTPGQDETLPPRGDTPTHSGGRASAIPRKRRIGRPPKYPRPEVDAPDDGTGQSPIRVTTPVKRRRGRPAASGGRWARNRGPSHITQPPVDKDGNVMQVVDDEVVVPGDPEGDTKVNSDGHLQDGREYRVRTFTLLNRGDKLYMLSTEPARCIGFRDSYLFFQKHRLLYKIIIDDDAKRDLIERDILPHSYKGRAIGVVTARSVFREFGAKIVVGGKKVLDDYNTQEARERGDVEGEVAVPEDRLPPPGEPYNRNQFVAWHGASSVYHTATPAAPLPIGKAVDSKKRKVTVTGDNWMLEHAREAR